MQTLTGYHLKATELASDLVDHGYGEMTIRVSSLKDEKVKIEIVCGKSYVFFIKKSIVYQERNDLI